MNLSQQQMLEKYSDLVASIIECSDGWNDILFNLFEELQKIKDSSCSSLKIIQIKEKYGSLRVYTEYDSEDETQDPKNLEQIVSDAETLSTRTCELCGSNKPKTKIRKINGGYLSCVCVLCFEKQRKTSNDDE